MSTAAVTFTLKVALYEAHNERYARAGVRWWKLCGFGLWLRNTRIHPIQGFDPRPKLHLGRYRVAMLMPWKRVRRTKKTVPVENPYLPADYLEMLKPVVLTKEWVFQSRYPTLTVNTTKGPAKFTAGTYETTDADVADALIALASSQPSLLSQHG